MAIATIDTTPTGPNRLSFQAFMCMAEGWCAQSSGVLGAMCRGIHARLVDSKLINRVDSKLISASLAAAALALDYELAHRPTPAAGRDGATQGWARIARRRAEVVRRELILWAR